MFPRSFRGRGVSAAFMALTFLCAGRTARASELTLGTVLLPKGIGTLARQEIERLVPGVVTQEYAGDKVKLDPGDALVIFLDRCPKAVAEIHRKGKAAGLPLAVSRYDQRTVFVFIRDLEDALGDDPRLKIALGRLVAHELEHVRRQSPEHDETGYFKACLSRDDLLRLGTAGARSARLR